MRVFSEEVCHKCFRAVRKHFPQGAQNPIRYVGVHAV